MGRDFALGSTKLNGSQLVCCCFWVLNRFEILSIQNGSLHQAAVKVSSERRELDDNFVALNLVSLPAPL